MITVIDYGMGNLRSVQKAFQRIGHNANISSNSKDISKSDKLILPGVGFFEKGVHNLKENCLWDVLNELVINKKIPILGICLGMQLMTEFSEEGNTNGFGWIKGVTKKFVQIDKKFKIPHMGWNNLSIINDKTLLKGITNTDFFYFVHSYFVTCNNMEDIVSETFYNNKFVSVFQHNNIFGCQFHPEKSHDAGLMILKNFAEF